MKRLLAGAALVLFAAGSHWAASRLDPREDEVRIIEQTDRRADRRVAHTEQIERQRQLWPHKEP